jgi:hypothetical protein
LALDLDERVKVGLVTLCTREKELYLEQFEQQILSRRMVAVLAARADRLIDSVRDKGVAGYEEWLSNISRLTWFSAALGAPPTVERLTQQLADRFETLMVSQRAGRVAVQHRWGRPPGADASQTRGGNREPAGRGRQRAQGAVAAVSGYAESSRRASSARRHPLRGGGICQRLHRASSAARSTTTCATSRRAAQRHRRASAARPRPGAD